jgi:uncharacterized OB-fold protein
MISISPVKIWRHQKEITSLLQREGRIISWTMIRVPPEGFGRQAPYPVVLVKLKGGPNRMGQLVNWQNGDLKIGRKVITVYRRVRQPDPEGVIPYGIKFKPV